MHRTCRKCYGEKIWNNFSSSCPFNSITEFLTKNLHDAHCDRLWNTQLAPEGVKHIAKLTAGAKEHLCLIEISFSAVSWTLRLAYASDAPAWHIIISYGHIQCKSVIPFCIGCLIYDIEPKIHHDLCGFLAFLARYRSIKWKYGSADLLACSDQIYKSSLVGETKKKWGSCRNSFTWACWAVTLIYRSLIGGFFSFLHHFNLWPTVYHFPHHPSAPFNPISRSLPLSLSRSRRKVMNPWLWCHNSQRCSRPLWDRSQAGRPCLRRCDKNLASLGGQTLPEPSLLMNQADLSLHSPAPYPSCEL